LQSDQRPKPDYPHSDSTWPHSPDVAEEHFGKIPSEERRKVVYGKRRAGLQAGVAFV